MGHLVRIHILVLACLLLATACATVNKPPPARYDAEVVSESDFGPMVRCLCAVDDSGENCAVQVELSEEQLDPMDCDVDGSYLVCEDAAAFLELCCSYAKGE